MESTVISRIWPNLYPLRLVQGEKYWIKIFNGSTGDGERDSEIAAPLVRRTKNVAMIAISAIWRKSSQLGLMDYVLFDSDIELEERKHLTNSD